MRPRSALHSRNRNRNENEVDMVRIDLNKADASLIAGIDAWEVIDCEVRYSKAGDQMLGMKFARISDRGDYMFDILMLEGPGWGLGKQKLAALLGDGFDGDIEVDEFRGKQVWIAAKVEEYNGKSSLKPDIRGSLKNAGMQAIEDVPPGCEAPEPPTEAPF